MFGATVRRDLLRQGWVFSKLYILHYLALKQFVYYFDKNNLIVIANSNCKIIKVLIVKLMCNV